MDLVFGRYNSAVLAERDSFTVSKNLKLKEETFSTFSSVHSPFQIVKLVTILLEMTEIIQGMGNFGSFV